MSSSVNRLLGVPKLSGIVLGMHKREIGACACACAFPRAISLMLRGVEERARLFGCLEGNLLSSTKVACWALQITKVRLVEDCSIMTSAKVAVPQLIRDDLWRMSLW